MRIEVESAAGALAVDLDGLASVLQPAAHVPYAPPHVFPMSTPNFADAPEAERPRPSGDPLGVYIHIPFCRYACNFCFYVKTIGADRAEMERYVRALETELAWLPENTPLTQLFIGGGTPTALPADLFASVLEAALSRVDRSCENIHTVECSPETLTSDHIRILDDYRIGRVSMGVQTLEDSVLKRVQRQHTSGEALDACERLVDSGRMVNVDLIYGLPGQTKESFRRDFKAVAERGVHSFNAYNLRVNESTPVLNLLRPDERLELAQLVRWRAWVERTAQELGYEQTHWQRFLRKGTSFDLDLTSDNLFGAGVSARSFLSGVVYRNHPKPGGYRERIEAGRSPVEEIFELDEEYRKTHFLTRTLGAGKRLERRAYEQRFGNPFEDDYGPVYQRLVDADLLEESDGWIAQTATGRLVYDLVTLAFYPPRLQQWLEDRHAGAMARRARAS